MSFFKKLFGIKDKEDESVYIPKPYIAPTKSKSSSIDELLENNSTQSFDKDFVKQNSETGNTINVEKQINQTSLSVFDDTTKLSNKVNSNPDKWSTYTDDNGKKGYKDENENILIQADYDDAYNFSSQLAVVKTGNNFGMINGKAEYVLQPLYSYIYDIKEGMILLEKDELFGFALPDGSIKINFQYEYAGEFCEGLAVVSKNGRSGYIDSNNNTVIEFNFDDAGDFSEGMAYAVPFLEDDSDEDSEEDISFLYGFINKSGKFVIQPQFDDAGDFKEGLAPVEVKGKWGYINKQGALVCEPVYYEANEFYQGLSAVRNEKNGKCGFADKTGKLVIDYQFDYMSNFMDTGIAHVFINGKCLTLLPDGTFKK